MAKNLETFREETGLHVSHDIVGSTPKEENNRKDHALEAFIV